MIYLKVNSIPYRPKKAAAIDIDTGGIITMLEVFFNSKYLGKTNVRVRLSPHNGFHVYSDEGFTQHEAEMLGDCKGRLRYWTKQGYTFTFNRKMTWNNRTIGAEQDFNPLSEPFYIAEGRLKR